MKVLFVSSPDTARANGSGESQRVLLRETTAGMPLNGEDAVVLDAPDEVLIRYRRNGTPAAFEVPTTLVEGFPIVAYRTKNGSAPVASRPTRRRWRGMGPVLAGLGVLAVGAAIVGLRSDSDSPSGHRANASPAVVNARPAAPKVQHAARAVHRPRSRALGSATHGRLVHGVRFPAKGKSFFTWDATRAASPNPGWRRYGTDTVVATVERVLRSYGREHPRAARVGVADLSLRRGGFFGLKYGGRGHLSHQNGLDVDVLYPRRDGALRPPASPREIDRRLAQDLLNRFLAGGARFVVIGPNIGLKGPRAKIRFHPLHRDHMLVHFGKRLK
jgi:hypothetical protein